MCYTKLRGPDPQSSSHVSCVVAFYQALPKQYQCATWNELDRNDQNTLIGVVKNRNQTSSTVSFTLSERFGMNRILSCDSHISRDESSPRRHRAIELSNNPGTENFNGPYKRSAHLNFEAEKANNSRLMGRPSNLECDNKEKFLAVQINIWVLTLIPQV